MSQKNKIEEIAGEVRRLKTLTLLMEVNDDAEKFLPDMLSAANNILRIVSNWQEESKNASTKK